MLLKPISENNEDKDRLDTNILLRQITTPGVKNQFCQSGF